MYSYENPKIKNKRIKKDKRYKLIRKTFAVAGATIVFLTSTIFLASKSKAFEPEPEQIISEYYGDESTEYDIVSYIELSKEIDKINLEKYDIAPYLFEKYNISETLKSPEEIKILISNAKNINAFISSREITKQSENIETILNLITQKKLINDYIYEEGYNVALYDIEQELKEYAGEVFGVEGENLKFEHKFENSSGDNRITIKNGNKRYNNNIFSNNTEKDIRKGIETLEQTRYAYNKYGIEYDKNRNESILNALKVSAELSKENDENDLYNERMASKLR